jgi:predicted nucleic acid-binding protein
MALSLPAAASHDALRAVIAHGIRGGALYDALIAATAAHHGHQLLSADPRAARTDAALNIDVVFLPSS